MLLSFIKYGRNGRIGGEKETTVKSTQLLKTNSFPSKALLLLTKAALVVVIE